MIRWLVAGAGGAGRAHIAAIARTPNARLVGIGDPRPGAGPAERFTTVGEAIAATKPNAVVIAAPNDTHLAIARLAVDAGVAVLCEKPVGRSLADAEAIADLAAARGAPVGVVLNQRALAATRWISRLIQSGQLAPTSIAFSGDVARLSGWHADSTRSGGGALRTLGIHYLDLLLWWLGEPSSLQAACSGGPPEDAFDVALSFANGCLGRVAMAARRETSAGPIRCVIAGDRQRLVMEGHRVVEATGVPPPPEPEGTDDAMIFGPGHLAVIAEATAALGVGTEFPLPLREVLPVLRLIERIYALPR